MKKVKEVEWDWITVRNGELMSDALARHRRETGRKGVVFYRFEELRKPFLEGYHAGLRGTDPRLCPYEKMTKEYRDWQLWHGWGTMCVKR